MPSHILATEPEINTLTGLHSKAAISVDIHSPTPFTSVFPTNIPQDAQGVHDIPLESRMPENIFAHTAAERHVGDRMVCEHK